MSADSASPTPASFRSNRPAELMTTRVGEILWVSAKEALFMAFLVSILGSVAIGILSGICGTMTPSLPPGLEVHPTLTSWWHSSQDAIHRHAFVILFLALFVVKSALRLAHYSSDPRQRNAAARALWATRRISRDWFSLLIKNAFAAFVGVLVLQFVQNFSLTHWLWEAIRNVFSPVLQAAVRLVGGSLPGLVERWLSWYGANQMKFAFWLLYSAALCDDLGLPNYKTLARRAWKRFFKADTV
jgi:hypothetical protein